MSDLIWGNPAAPLHFSFGPDSPVRAVVAPADIAAPARYGATPGAVEILAVGHGRALTSTRLDRTAIGARLRYRSHSERTTPEGQELEIVQLDEATGLEARLTLTRLAGAAYRAVTSVTNRGERAITLQAVSSLVLTGLTGFLGPRETIEIATARGEWCAESRWFTTPLDGQDGLPDIDPTIYGHVSRGFHAVTSTSTWSSGEYLPVAGLTGGFEGHAIAWQLEHNGPWRWELNAQYDQADWFSLALMGPTDLSHGWLQPLAPGESFTSIPVSFALSGDGLTGAIGELTEHRRRSHIAATADRGRPLIFNDYMNALMGDPTDEKLLPLIDAAAKAGAQYFCIDCGWYDDGWDWWPSVGAWEPSKRRFGSLGLTGVLDYIRERGMRPGLWVEPEVIGVRSPKADELPEECFMRRGGARIVEHDRYFLDLRSAAAREYLDGVFDRLINEYGARYFKWDYNVTPGMGPDVDAPSPGAALLEHCRAQLAWFEQLRERHPDVIFEACSSGAQRMDPAIVARYDLQSTSDQQDYLRYPPIAAAAPMAMPPEQAGNWAYPQSEMTDEQIAFNLVTGLSGRLYLSGNLDRLDEAQLGIVRAATALYPEVIAHHARALPHWPLGLPGWTDPVVALGSDDGESDLVFVWQRDAAAELAELRLERFAGREVSVETLFPTTMPAWPCRWDAAAATLSLDLSGHGECARILRVRAV